MTNPQDPFAAPGDEPSGDQPSGPPPPPPPGYGAPPPPGYGAPPPPGYGAPPPPGYGAAPGYGAPPPYGQPYGQGGYNTLAIVGFIASFLCSPAGIVMGLIARNQIKQRGEKGDGLAIAAIAIGAIGMVLGLMIAFSGG